MIINCCQLRTPCKRCVCKAFSLFAMVCWLFLVPFWGILFPFAELFFQHLEIAFAYKIAYTAIDISGKHMLNWLRNPGTDEVYCCFMRKGPFPRPRILFLLCRNSDIIGSGFSCLQKPLKKIHSKFGAASRLSLALLLQKALQTHVCKAFSLFAMVDGLFRSPYALSAVNAAQCRSGARPARIRQNSAADAWPPDRSYRRILRSHRRRGAANRRPSTPTRRAIPTQAA